MNVERTLPTPEAGELLDLVGEFARDELAPRAAAAERDGAFPRDVFTKIGGMGLLGLPYSEEHGGAGLPYEVFLQVVEELARSWLTVGLGVSVHTLSCFPLARYGSTEQKNRWLPTMLGGAQLGAYCLSEPDSGSDAAGLRTRAAAVEGGYRLDGTKAWITHGGVADFYTVMARTSDDGARGISCFQLFSDDAGLTAATPEHKMGLRASPTAQMRLDGVAAAGPLSEKAKVLMLSYSEDEQLVTGAIRNGAAGYLVHGRFEPDDLEARIKAVASGEMVLSPAVTPAVFETLRRAPGTENESDELGMGSLTSREREVLNLLARGMSNAAIAEELFITNKTVKNHLSRIYEKIGVHSRAEAIALWLGVRDR